MNRSQLSLRHDLLDAQLVDADGIPFGKVEDVELEMPATVPPRVTAVLTGLEALGRRAGGTLGRWVADAAARLRSRAHPEGPVRIDVRHIATVRPLVSLDVRLEELPEVAPLEQWLRRHLVGRIPGASGVRD